MDVDAVLDAAREAKANGATRFCMGAAWRSPKDRDLEKVEVMVREVKALGLETCLTLGMLKPQQAQRLADAGLDYYNHNLDTSPEFYGKIISTRTYEDRLDTLTNVRDAGIKVCCGGIVGMGEGAQDRAELLRQLANMTRTRNRCRSTTWCRSGHAAGGHRRARPAGVRAHDRGGAHHDAASRYVRLSAGRTEMSDELQALCFFAGANSIFYGEKLLTTGNPQNDKDRALFAPSRHRIGCRTRVRRHDSAARVPDARAAQWRETRRAAARAELERA